jgi:O-antigen/teichoic acid export membrane protein
MPNRRQSGKGEIMIAVHQIMMKLNIIFGIKSKHARSRNIQKHILASFLLKGISIGINLLLVPLTLHYLDKERYGLWLTMSSVIGWFSLFDIGLGHGFRNKFAEAIALKKSTLAKTYVSTTIILLSIIICLVLSVFLIINPFLNWNLILNTKIEPPGDLSILANIIFVFFALQFIFKLTTSVLLADQKSSLVDFIGVAGSLLSLISIYILMRVNQRSLLFLGLTLSACPVLVLMVTYFILFNGAYKLYKPSIKYIDLKQSKDLLGLGFLFFIPQVCSLIIFSTSNIIIAQLFTPAEVTIYNIAYRYFSLIIIFFNILITPFWSAFTEAFVKKDNLWIKNVIYKLIMFWLISCLVVIVMIGVSGQVFYIWLGGQITIPFQLKIGLAIYACISNWNNIFAFFINGISKIFLQVWISVFGGIAFIPLTIILAKNFGLIGVPLGMAISILGGTLIMPIQCKKIINGTARGIWNK